jgi:predicted MPP superfamily phosphohydrolase
MDQIVKIAHLSDLHCVENETWETNFDNLRRCLAKEAPEYIFITGDCVDNPFRKATFDYLAKKLGELYESINNAHRSISKETNRQNKPFIYLVPGNHDYYLYGNKILPNFLSHFLPWRHNFSLSLDKMIKPSSFKTAKDMRDQIYLESDIAIFDIDSNAIRNPISMAQGRIEKPSDAISQQDIFYGKFAEKHNKNYQDAIKIALLHHHPLPIPYLKRAEAKREKLMILENSYEFLQSALANRISMIFHGHKHTQGESKFSYCDEGNPLIVSSCGSSCSTKNESTFIKIIDISKGGESKMKSLRATGLVDFKEDTASSKIFIKYKNIRELRNRDPQRFPDTCNLPVKEIKKKKKVVCIDRNGTGMVYIAHDEVIWKEAAQASNLSIREHLTGFNGRVPGVLGKISNNRCDDFDHNSYYARDTEKWSPTVALKLEEYTVDIAAEPNININSPSWAKLLYFLFNGYAISVRHHMEMYSMPEVSGKLKKKRKEEISTIRIDYPTEWLELRVQFLAADGANIFPKPESVYFQAIPIRGGKLPDQVQIFNGTISGEDNPEYKYLLNASALEINEKIGEISLIVRHPQPDYLYVLRWGVCVIDDRIKLNTSNEKIMESIRKELLQGIGRSTKFYESIKKEIIDYQIFSDKSLEYIILGYDDGEKLLRPSLLNTNLYEKCGGLGVGRGPAGKAFKMGRAEYYYSSSSTGMESIPVEQVIEGLKPAAVLAMPIYYHVISNDVSREKVPPVLGVLSIVLKTDDFFEGLAHDEKSLFFFGPLETDNDELLEKRRINKEKAIKNISDIIAKQVLVHFPEVLKKPGD